MIQVPNSGWSTIVLRNRLFEQQTLHTIQIVIHLLSIRVTNKHGDNKMYEQK